MSFEAYSGTEKLLNEYVEVGPRIFLYFSKLLNEYAKAGPRILIYLDKVLNEYGDAWSWDFPLFI
jgi:hypothetical protein